MKKGFSLIELLIAIFILQLSLLAFFTVNQSSSAKGVGAYYRFMAYSLGNEVIDFTKGMGYKWAKMHLDASGATDPFPLSQGNNDGWHDVCDHYIFSKNEDGADIDVNDAYFSECQAFERRIEFKEIEIKSLNDKPFNAIRVVVQLRTKGGSRAASFLNNDTLTFSTTIMELGHE